MYSTFLGLETALRGLHAGRTGMDTTGHNVANANTPGYTRQRIVQQAELPYTIPSLGRPGNPPVPGQLGTGVVVQAIQRVRDFFLDGQIRNATSDLGNWEAQNGILTEIESIFNEPAIVDVNESSLTTMMANFWSSWQELSKNAESVPLRTTLVYTAVTLANGLNHMNTQIEDTILANQHDLVNLNIQNEINSKAQQIADLNDKIAYIKSVGDQPNDLMDQRDLLLDELSKTTNITTTDQADGSIYVDIGTYNLVDATGAHTLADVVWPAAVPWPGVQPPDPLDAPPYNQITEGAIKGIKDVLIKAKNYEDMLSVFANELITVINAQHTAGFDLNSVAGGVFFTGTNAGDIAVDNAIYNNTTYNADVTKVAAASAAGAQGDGSKALAIAQIQNKQYAPIANATFDEYYKSIISKLGVEAQESKVMVNNQQVVVDTLTKRKESVSGVSLDEEMSKLIQYQYAYQGAARVMTMLDTLLDTLINRMAV